MIFAGAILLLIAAGAWFWARSERGDARRATATETLACGDVSSLSKGVADEVGGGSFTQRCEVVGAAEAGPSGALKAPQSKVDAVWTKTEVIHKYWVMEEHEVDGRTQRRRDNREEVVSSIESEAPFAVADGSGAVLVDPRGAQIDEPEQVVDRFQPGDQRAGDSFLESLFRAGDDSGTVGFQHREWIIRPGARLYVQGEVADRTGQLTFAEPKDDGPFLISTRSEEEIVSGALRSAKIATWVAGASALAGVALLGVGIA